MNLQYYKSIAKKFAQDGLADSIIDIYKLESGIYDWNFNILDAVISLMYVKGYSYDYLIRYR